jgi:hypothetical protein
LNKQRNRDFMKGQYFSFDAIVAAVIMVLAFTTLLTYWFGVQAVTASQTTSLYPTALSVSDLLFTPGSPVNWQDYDYQLQGPSYVNQFQVGLSDNYTSELNESKVLALQYWTNTSKQTNDYYGQIGSLLHVSGANLNYYIVIQPTNPGGANGNGMDSAKVPQPLENYTIGMNFFGFQTDEVAVANRGAVLSRTDGTMVPVSVRVYIWRNTGQYSCGSMNCTSGDTCIEWKDGRFSCMDDGDFNSIYYQSPSCTPSSGFPLFCSSFQVGNGVYSGPYTGTWGYCSTKAYGCPT